ncbi:MAG: DUF3137 domain-containing protein [Nonlabens sp.]
MQAQQKQFLQEKTTELKKKQQKYLRLFKIAKFTVFPLNFVLKIASFILLIVSIVFPPAILFLVGAIVAQVILYFVFNDPRESFEAYVKEDLLPQIFEKFYPQYIYDPYEYNSQDLKESGFFSKSFFDKNLFIQGEDRVTGTVKGVDVDFSEVYFYKKETLWIKTIFTILLAIILLPIYIIWMILNGENEIELGGSLLVKRTVNYYRGLFVCADFHKSLQGQDIMLVPKHIETAWEKFKTRVFTSNFKEISVESPIINERFKVLTTNTQIGYYALSPSLLQTIVDIIEREKVTPMICLRNDKLYMSIPWSHDYFKVDLFQPIENETYLTEYFKDLESFERIITSFKLDVKIWSKT